jgi:hypothetical protein
MLKLDLFLDAHDLSPLLRCLVRAQLELPGTMYQRTALSAGWQETPMTDLLPSAEKPIVHRREFSLPARSVIE